MAMYPVLLFRPPGWTTLGLAQRCAEILESRWFEVPFEDGTIPSIEVRTPTNNVACPGFARFHGPEPWDEPDSESDGYTHFAELRRQCEDVESLAGEWFQKLKALGIPMRLEDCGGIVLETFDP